MNEEEIIADLKKAIEYAQNCCREDAYINQETLFAVLNLLEKKDKIINEMAKELSDMHFCTNRKDCNIYKATRSDCKECIKQYFEEEVENGN